MKKVLSFLLLALLIGVSMPAEAAEQAKSEVGITFYQPSNKNQTIPMEKVSMNDSKSDAPQMGQSQQDQVLKCTQRQMKKNHFYSEESAC